MVDAGDYSGACRLHLESLTSQSYGDVCSSSYTTVVPTVCETVDNENAADRQNVMEVEETPDSGYDSAQSYQPVQANNCISVPSSQSSESTLADDEFHLSKTGLSSNTQNTAMSGISRVLQQCARAVVPSELDDRDFCNVQQHIVGSDSDTVFQKLHAPVDFYTSFNYLVTGLQSHAVS